jgi:hypothetical protein
MNSVILNKKKYYTSEFIEEVSDKYCNLEIYPFVGILETEAGILSDLADSLGDTIYRLYGDPELGSNQFVKDNLKNFFETGKYTFIRISPEFTDIPDFNGVDAVLCLENSVDTTGFTFRVKFRGIEKVLYLTDITFKHFKKNFKNYPCVDGIYEYSNLICLCMIVKDAGPLFEKVLNENLNIIDQWCILDTGSTDGTQDVIRRVLKNKKGTLYEEPFVDFMTSRNRCLELAGHTCKFIIMLDDTYSVRGDLRTFLTE